MPRSVLKSKTVRRAKKRSPRSHHVSKKRATKTKAESRVKKGKTKLRAKKLTKKPVKLKTAVKTNGLNASSLIKSTQTEVFALIGDRQLASSTSKLLSGFRKNPKDVKNLASVIVRIAKLGNPFAVKKTIEAVSKSNDTQLQVFIGESLLWVASSTKEGDAVSYCAQSVIDFSDNPLVTKKVANSLLYIAKYTKDPYAVVRSAMAISKLKDNPNAGMRMANILYSYVNHQKDVKDIGMKVAVVADQFLKSPMS